jgi:ABC-type nitrate/sulfonate/bicarbonate transport system ATPase subunit
VREPKLFLFDEPLSNLDAALRVDTRLEIARCTASWATMIYVTHDQVEAMTLADKIVVLRGPGRADRLADGALQQAGQHVRRRLHRLAADEFPPIRRSARISTRQGRRLKGLGKQSHSVGCADLENLGIRPAIMRR